MKEPGTVSLDHIYERAELRQLEMAFSAWNVGEVLGALDQRHQKGHLTGDAYSTALFNFADETLRVARLGALQLVPVGGLTLAESWKILQEEHLYAADALQIASCKTGGCELFASADGRLLGSAGRQGLKGLDPVRDEKKILAL